MDRSSLIMGIIVLSVCLLAFLILLFDTWERTRGRHRGHRTSHWSDDGLHTVPLSGNARQRPASRSSLRWNDWLDSLAHTLAASIVFLNAQVWWRHAGYTITYATGYILGKLGNSRVIAWLKQRASGLTSNGAVKLILLIFGVLLFAGIKGIAELIWGKGKDAMGGLPQAGGTSWLWTLGKVAGALVLLFLFFLLVRWAWRKIRGKGAQPGNAASQPSTKASAGGRAQVFWVLGTIYAIVAGLCSLALLWEPIGWEWLYGFSAPLVSLALLFFLVLLPLSGIAHSMLKDDDIKKKYASEVATPRKTALIGIALWMIISAWSIGSASSKTGQSFMAKAVDCTLGSYLACSRGGPLGRNPLGPAVEHGGERHYFVGMTKFAPTYPLAIDTSRISKFYLDPQREANGFLTEIAIPFDGTFSGQPVSGVISIASSGADGGVCQVSERDKKTHKVCDNLPWGIDLRAGQRMFQAGLATVTIMPDFTVEIGLSLHEVSGKETTVTYLGKVVLMKNVNKEKT